MITYISISKFFFKFSSINAWCIQLVKDSNRYFKKFFMINLSHTKQITVKKIHALTTLHIPGALSWHNWPIFLCLLLHLLCHFNGNEFIFFNLVNCTKNYVVHNLGSKTLHKKSSAPWRSYSYIVVVVKYYNMLI